MGIILFPSNYNHPCDATLVPGGFHLLHIGLGYNWRWWAAKNSLSLQCSHAFLEPRFSIHARKLRERENLKAMHCMLAVIVQHHARSRGTVHVFDLLEIDPTTLNSSGDWDIDTTTLLEAIKCALTVMQTGASWGDLMAKNVDSELLQTWPDDQLREYISGRWSRALCIRSVASPLALHEVHVGALKR
ncbi:hypothetical protein HD554DRAFT_285037 [Boletus coccyginus]|nr:hypothetical protein HD554DRAFT_285037 [Boletus coccyginus]